jgi:hypothetical protein
MKCRCKNTWTTTTVILARSLTVEDPGQDISQGYGRVDHSVPCRRLSAVGSLFLVLTDGRDADRPLCSRLTHSAANPKLSETAPLWIQAQVLEFAEPGPYADMHAVVVMVSITAMVAVVSVGNGRGRTSYRRTEHHYQRQQDRESLLQGYTPSFLRHSRRYSIRHGDRAHLPIGLVAHRSGFDFFRSWTRSKASRQPGGYEVQGGSLPSADVACWLVRP